MLSVQTRSPKLPFLHQENMSVKCITPYTQLLKRKNGFAGVYLIFLSLIQNMQCGCSLEPPHKADEAVVTCTHNVCFEQKF